MALIDVRCLSCETVSEVFRAKEDWPATPPCPKCEGSTEQIHLPAGVRSYAPAVVVYKTPEGEYRFPGDPSPDSRTAKMYATLGYERQEFRGWADVRRLEATVNTKQQSEIRRRLERQIASHEEGTRMRRSDVYHGLNQGFQIPELHAKGQQTGRMKTVHMTPHGRDLVRAAIDRNDGKPRFKTYDAGFHVEAFSFDRSNRDESRDGSGKKFRD